MNRQQLEMRFDGTRSFRPAVRRQRRLTRARWWFDQMHSVVDRAMDWQSASAPQPGQVNLTLSRRS